MDRSATEVAIPGHPPLPLIGGCPCGAIRYEISAAPLLLYACHCTRCQRQSGSSFALNMRVAAAAFRIVQGQPKGWRRVAPSGAETTSWFCGDCGGRIHGSRPSRPDAIVLRSGSLDDTSWLVPAAHIFVSTAQRWLDLPKADCYDIVPPNFAPLEQAWRAAWDQAPVPDRREA
jgi:hypothetical protein